MKYGEEGFFSYFQHINMENPEQILKIWVHHRVKRPFPVHYLLTIGIDLFCCWTVLFDTVWRANHKHHLYSWMKLKRNAKILYSKQCTTSVSLLSLLPRTFPHVSEKKSDHNSLKTFVFKWSNSSLKKKLWITSKF